MKRDVRLRLECALPEKLLDRALRRGVAFARVERPDARTLIVETDAAGARVLRTLCVRFSIPGRLLARRGRSAAREYVKRRFTLAAGLLTGAALVALMLGRIWRVDVRFTGDAAARGDPAAFAELLAELGVRPGMSRAIDTRLLSDALAARSEGYSFVSARLQGVRLLVEAAPETPAPALYDVDFARDLVSRCDGVVMSASAQSGELCVKPGDAVRRGDVLIRGEERASPDGTRAIGALGEVMVRTWYSGRACVPLAEPRVEPTGRTSRSSRLALPWAEWTLAGGERFESARRETRTLPIVGLFIPLQIIRDTFYETRGTEAPVDIETASTRAAALSMADAASRLTREGPDEYDILRSWLNFEPPRDGTLRCGAVYEIITNAAVTRDILTQEDSPRGAAIEGGQTHWITGSNATIPNT